MVDHGLREGDEYAVVVYQNGVSVAEVTGTIITGVETAASLYTDGDETLITAVEILSIAYGAAKFYLEKPTLARLLRERIDELKRMDEGAGKEDPPAPSISDIPF